MKDEKQYEWVDVTKECSAKLSGDYGSEVWVSVQHDTKCIFVLDGNHNQIATRNYGDYRITVVSDGNFRIERRIEVEQPKPKFKFKYTPEFVKNLDCKNMSVESVLRHDLNKWNERTAAHEAGLDGGDMPELGPTCPSCRRNDTCSTCELNDGTSQHRSCFKAFKAYCVNPNERTACAVADYISDKLTQLRKPEPWVPRVGDRVRDSLGNEGVIIIISERGQLVVDYEKVLVHAECDSDLTLIEAAQK